MDNSEEETKQRYALYTEECLKMQGAEPWRISATAATTLRDILLHHAPERGCWPSIETISRDTGRDRKTTIRNVKQLQEKHWMRVDKLGRRNHYSLLVNEDGVLLGPFATNLPTSPTDGTNSIGTKNGTDKGPKTGTSKVPEVGPQHTKEHTKEQTPPSIPPKEKKRKDPPVFGEDTFEYKFALLLRRLILRNNGNAKVPADTPEGLARWAGVMDAMQREDNRDPHDMVDVIEWSQNDDFWCTIILSAEKLRKKYDQLRLKMLKEKEAQERRGHQTYDHPSLRGVERPQTYDSEELRD